MISTVEAAPGTEQRKLPSTVAWLCRVAVWMVLLGSVTLLAVAVLIPRLAGATPYTILTGSMRPTMPPGTLVVVKPTTFAEIAAGDVVTFQLASGKPAVVTHRVVSVVTNLDGKRSLRTQGDANPVPDADLVRPVQVRGTVWYSVPHLGRLSVLLTGSERQTGVYAVAGGFALYAVWMFGGALMARMRSEGKRQKGDS